MYILYTVAIALLAASTQAQVPVSGGIINSGRISGYHPGSFGGNRYGGYSGLAGDEHAVGRTYAPRLEFSPERFYAGRNIIAREDVVLHREERPMRREDVVRPLEERPMRREDVVPPLEERPMRHEDVILSREERPMRRMPSRWRD